MDPTRLALEANLRGCPDDTAAHAAYSDYLAEHDDPRGEYIRLQLALEDRDQPPARLRAMGQEAHRIRQLHERDWLGPLYPFVHPDRAGLSIAEPVGPAVDVQYRRGWVQRVQIRGLTQELAAALAGCPLAAMLEELDVGPADDGGAVPDEPFAEWAAPQFGEHPVTAAPFAESLHRLTVSGAGPELRRLLRVICAARSLRELDVSGPVLDIASIMLNLRYDVQSVNMTASQVVSRVVPDPSIIPAFTRLVRFHAEAAYPLQVPLEWLTTFVPRLARSLPGVQHLTLRMVDLADSGVEALLASGLVDRLTGLDLCRCRITDDGARMLAAHAAVPRLEYLRLANNYMSPMGIADLAAVGVTVSEQQDLGPPRGDEYTAGDDEVVF